MRIINTEVENYKVYMLTSPSGKRYIGLTKQDVKQRWGSGRHYPNNRFLTNAIKKYGWENLKHEVLREGMTEEEAKKYEVEMIAKYNTTDREHGYNITLGGDGGHGLKHTEEAKRKIAEASVINNAKRAISEYKHVSDNKKIPIKVFDMDGDLLAICTSSIVAEKLTGVDNSNICAACRGKYKQFKGYIFRYLSDDSPVTKVRSHSKPINMFDKSGKFIKRFPSIISASKELNISDAHIIRCLKGTVTHAKGYVFEYD